MEPVSFTASLITLVKTVEVIARTATTLCRNIQDAPNELVALRLRLMTLQVELEALRHLATVELEKILPDTLKSSLLHALHIGYGALKDIHEVCEKSCDKPGVGGRLKWALLDHSLVAKQLESLKGVEGSLTLLFQVVAT